MAGAEIQSGVRQSGWRKAILTGIRYNARRGGGMQSRSSPDSSSTSSTNDDRFDVNSSNVPCIMK